MRHWRSKRPGGGVPPRAVHQLVVRLAWGDAIGNQVRYLRELLRSWGYASEIYAAQWDEECTHQVRPAEDYLREAAEDDALLIHHSYESRLVPLLKRAPGRKALLYHNITPARLFEGLDQALVRGCKAARQELLELRPLVERAFAWSRFSAEELSAAGYPHVAVLPFAVDWRSFDVAPEPALREQLADGYANILFVGRAVPSKRLEDVLRVFTAYQQLYQPRSRLVVAGALDRESPYGSRLLGTRELLGPEHVLLLGKVSAAQLSACFSAASVYLSMSRHEGFGVPLLEAMYRQVPVVAYAAAAVPETLGGAGIGSLSADPLDMARLLAALERSPPLREQVLAGQRARLESLSQQQVTLRLREGLEPFLSGAPPAAASPPSASVELVCPAFLARPQAPECTLARQLAEQLPGARVLALDTQVQPQGLAPRRLQQGGREVLAYTPDEPLPTAATAPLPGCSALESAVCASPALPVFLPAHTQVALDTLPRLQRPAWGVRMGAAALPEHVALSLGRQLLQHDPQRPEQALHTLTQALRPLRGLRAR